MKAYDDEVASFSDTEEVIKVRAAIVSKCEDTWRDIANRNKTAIEKNKADEEKKALEVKVKKAEEDAKKAAEEARARGESIRASMASSSCHGSSGGGYGSGGNCLIGSYLIVSHAASAVDVSSDNSIGTGANCSYLQTHVNGIWCGCCGYQQRVAGNGSIECGVV